MAKKHSDDEALIADNRRARFDYEIDDTVECGIELIGSEVKSLRNKAVSFTDAYALVKGGQLFLVALKIEPYKQATLDTHARDRTRRLLCSRREIDKLDKLVRERGVNLVPMRLYFRGPWAKVLIGVGKGKSRVDKRDTIMKREANRDMERAMRRR
jgi:SsrA-binding protein